MVRITREVNGEKKFLWNYNRMVECKNKKEAIELLRSKGITDLTGIEFPVVKKLRDSRYTLFAKNWARIYLKTDTSKWNAVGNSIEIEYNERIKKDAKFRNDAESSSKTMSQEIAFWFDIIAHTQFKK